MNEDIKVMLGDAAENFTDAQITLAVKQATLQMHKLPQLSSKLRQKLRHIATASLTPSQK